MCNPASARACDKGPEREGARRTRGPRGGGGTRAPGPAPRASLRAHPAPKAKRHETPWPADTGKKPRDARRTHHRQGGGQSTGAGAQPQKQGTVGQGAARDAVGPGVPDTGGGTGRERVGAARVSPSARGTCDAQRVTQPLPPVASSLGGPGLAPGHSGSNQPTNQPTPGPVISTFGAQWGDWPGNARVFRWGDRPSHLGGSRSLGGARGVTLWGNPSRPC